MSKPKFGKLKDLGEVQEFTLTNGHCFVFFHQWKLIRAGYVSNKWRCERCGRVRFEPNV